MATIKQIKDTNNEVHDIGVKWSNVTDKPDAFIGYGTCSTAAATSAKVITMTDSDWHLEVGNIIGVKFSNSNSASSVTLNVSETGAKNIYYNNAKYTGNSTSICGYANRVLYYMYDGTYWVWLNMGSLDGNSNTVPCIQIETDAGTAAKTGTCTNYSLLSKSYAHANVRYANSAQSAITLNVNGKGTKPIYINGTASSSSNYTLPAGTYIIYYDGTNYHFRTDGNLPNVNIPSVGNGKITIKQGGTEKGSFTLNQSGNATIELTDNNNSTTESGHYSPSVTDSSKELTASLSGTAGSYAKNTEYTVLTGVKAQRDSKGHVTGLTYTAQKIKDTDSDTKVTSVGNHYTPSADSSKELTASLSGTAGSYAKDTEYTVLTGVKAQRDAAGHVTGLTYTAQKIKDTNTTYNAVTTSAAGLMSAADKTKLDGAATLSGDNTFTGDNEFDRCVSFNDGISVSGDTNFTGNIVQTVGTITTPVLHVAQHKTNGDDDVLANGGKIVFGDYRRDDIGNHGNHYACIEEINDDELTFTADSGFVFRGGDVTCDGNGAFCGNLNGTATKADALNLIVGIGSETKPVYFSASGKPLPCTYTLNKSVPANAVFTDTKYTHPAIAGYKHIPSGGSSGQILKYSSDGTANWGNISDGDIKYNSHSENGITAIDACHSGIYTANRLAFGKPAGIQIEYSRDGGSTWTNYNTTDSDKIKLISGTVEDVSYYIGGTTTGITTNYKLRVTIDANACGVYTSAKKILMKVRTNGATGSKVKFEYSTVGAVNTWINNGDDDYSISGWPAWNSIPFPENFKFGYNNSNTQTSYCAKIRMTFSIGKISSNNDYNNALSLLGIYLIGYDCYEANSRLAITGDIYTYDANQGVSFPGTVAAIGGFFETSDERLKDIVKPVTVDLEQLSKLRKVYFNWKDKPESNLQLGMIAQDIQAIYPELVSESEGGQLSLSYEKLSVVALEAIDVLHKENNELKNRIERLEILVNQLVENK